MSESLFSDHRPSVSNEIRSIAFCGGGRWGSILFQELFKQVPPSTTLIWVTRDADKKKGEWERKASHCNIEFIDKWQDRLTDCDGAVVATSVERHYPLCRDFLSASVPTLCEKPIAATIQQLEQLMGLAKATLCPFGIHLEFAYLEGFDEFVQKTNGIHIDRIQAQWFDPEIEIRGDIVKRAEYQCDIINDQVPHVWSLVSRLVPDTHFLRIDGLSYSPERTEISGKLGKASVEIQLSRRHETRRRLISINGGEATFDFCTEPPTATINNMPVVLGASLLRPLQHTLKSFLTQVREYLMVKADRNAFASSQKLDAKNCLDDSTEWLLSAQKFYPFLIQCIEASDRLRQVQDGMISQLLGDRDRESKELPYLQRQDVQLILDRWLPQGLASQEQYLPGSKENDYKLAKHILSSLYERP